MNSDTVNARLIALVKELNAVLDTQYEYIRPYEAALVAEIGISYAKLSHDLAGDEFMAGVSRVVASEADFVKSLSAEAIAASLKQLASQV